MVRAPLSASVAPAPVAVALVAVALLAAGCSKYPNRSGAEHAIQACALQSHARVVEGTEPNTTDLVIDTDLSGEMYTVGAACLRARFEIDGKDNLTILGGGDLGG